MRKGIGRNELFYYSIEMYTVRVTTVPLYNTECLCKQYTLQSTRNYILSLCYRRDECESKIIFGVQM